MNLEEVLKKINETKEEIESNLNEINNKEYEEIENYKINIISKINLLLDLLF